MYYLFILLKIIGVFEDGYRVGGFLVFFLFWGGFL